MNALFRPRTDIADWLVVYTEPRAENRAKIGIEEVGHEVFLPLEKLRQRIEKRNLWKQIERPVFSRYIFARPPAPDAWGQIPSIDGVVDVLRNNDRPSRVPAAFIDALRKAESYGVFDRTQNSPDPFEIGELVRVSAGPFAGHNAVIELIAKIKSTTAKKRAKVLLNFMGRKTSLDVDVCDLEKL